jgi:hypothetical protein
VTDSSTQTAALPYQRSPSPASFAPAGCLAWRGTVTGQLAGTDPGPGEPGAWLTGCRAGPAGTVPGDPRPGPALVAEPVPVVDVPPVQPGTATDMQAASAAATISLRSI